MGINGSVEDDLKWFYPDKTGFMFNTQPRNIASGRNSYGMSMDDPLYGGLWVEIPWNNKGGTYKDESEHTVSKYNGWLNWLHKYEIDNRFLAVSDKNAYLYQFPEVMSPWKFTEYIFKGMGDGYVVVEPPLYDPSTLIVVNGVKNEDNVNLLEEENKWKRREGTLKGEGYEDVYYEPVYYYRCKFNSSATDDDIKEDTPVLGIERKQYEPNPTLRKKNGDLESGLIIDGKRYPPWTDPTAHYRYRNTFVCTQKICGARRVFKYTTSNRGVITTIDSSGKVKEKHSGIRLYRKDILAKCVDIGEHGNIPKFTINMSAPKDYIEPDSMTRNVVEAIVTYSAGQAMYAQDDGFIHYDRIASYSNTEITIEPIVDGQKTFETISGKSGSRWEYELFNFDLGEEVIQPKPNKFNYKFQEKCYGGKSPNISNGQLVHRGCPFFVGFKTEDDDAGAVGYCKIKKDLLDSGKNPIDNPEDFRGMFGGKPPEEDDASGSDSGDEDDDLDNPDDSNDDENNNEEDEEIDNSLFVGEMDYTVCMSHSSGTGNTPPAGAQCRYYTEQGPVEILEFTCDTLTDEELANAIGYNQSVDAKNELSSAMMSIGPMGMITGIAIGAMTPPKIESRFSTLDGSSVRKKVTYEYKTVALNGREIEGKVYKYKDTRNVVEGTGKFAFDKKETSAIGGIDSDIFYGTNMMSRNRFNSSIMQCYNAKYCNKVYGTINLSSGYSDGVFTGVGADTNYCRYYNAGCPTTNIHQRAFEYDREYKKLLELVLSVFRMSGISGFEGLQEVSCGNAFAAVGTCKSLNDIASVRGSDGNIYFIYDKSKDDAKHKNSNVYAFITQYGHPTQGQSISENSYFKMNQSKYPLMSNLPPCFGSTTDIPWLVKLHDDYISPTRPESYVTNLRSFIGGRMPEYKDYTKLGEEVQCDVEIIEEGYDGDLTSGKGGDDRNKDYTVKKSYQYYRIDSSGEWIIEDIDDNGDGISVGTDEDGARQHGQARVGLPPGISNGARPIKGSYRNSSFSEEKGLIPARVTKGWCYSNDNRDSLENDMATQENEDGEGYPVPNAKPPEDCLPLERDWYYCPSCSPKPYSYVSNSSSYNGLNTFGEPNINQIFTDFEYEQYGKCPRCGTGLSKGGKMKHFAKCRAEGIVNYFGLPGELIDARGFFWKNHTEISRSFISEILSKNGSIIKGVYNRSDSAGASTESAVERKFQYGENYVRGYVNNARRKKMLSDSNSKSGSSVDLTQEESIYAMTNTRASEEIYVPSFMKNNVRMDNNTSGLKYNDRYINPYALKGSQINGLDGNGLDFISAGIIKSLRNMVMPIQGFPLYDTDMADTLSRKQEGHKQRFSQTDKYFKNRRMGINSFILASNDTGGELNYVQFWDGTLPGKTIKAYYPTSPVWWYRHDYVGGITRSGGTESKHFDNASANSNNNEFGYAGNVVSMSFHPIVGWLPLDKVVSRAIISFTPSEFPDCPPIGRTQQGGPMHENHWHSFVPEDFPRIFGKSHDKYDEEMLNGVMGLSEDVVSDGKSGGDSLGDGNYIPTNYNGEQFLGGDNILSQYIDTGFGFGIVQGWLDWDGYGEDIVQNVTEESVWKNYTFDEFKEIENKYTYGLDIEIGFETDDDFIQDHFTVMPKAISDGFLNNEGQSIPNMFNLSGINSSGLYDKNGLDFAEKKANTEWAEGGQVIVQSNDDTTYNATMSQALGQEINVDITKLVKRIYNERIARDFNAKGGLAYNEIYQYISENKIGLTGDDIDKKVNYRHYDGDIGGYWLNSVAFYPELQNGDFPTIEEGMEYKIKPEDICDIDACGKFSIESLPGSSNSESQDYAKDNPLYYKYSPYSLCFCDEDGKPSSGSITKDGSGFKFSGGDWNKCILLSGNMSDMFFVLNISGYPTQVYHRKYRNEAGSWNLANAICPNEKCFVHQDGVTVSEAAALSGARKVLYANRTFSPYSTKCGACGSDLTGASGAIYTGGDGIETWKYKDIPKKDCIVNGFVVDVENTKCGFYIYGKSSTDNYWEKLVSVRYDYDKNKYFWRQYDNNNNLIEVSSTVLPKFKGVWKDGYNAAKEPLTGYHFLAKRCNKIKVVANPCTRRSNGEYIENNGRIRELTDVMTVGPGNVVKENLRLFKTNLSNLSGCEGGMLDIMIGLNEEDVLSSIEIRSYNAQTRTLGLASPLPESFREIADQANDEQDENNGAEGGNGESEQGGNNISLDKKTYYYRIRLLRYKLVLKKFQVYGLEVIDQVKITDDASSLIIPIQQGVVSAQFYDKATKILKATAINGVSSLFDLKDVGDTQALTPEQLFYIVKYDNETKRYNIVGMQFFYDTLLNVMYFPYQCVTEDGKFVKEIDNIFNGLVVNQNTVPTAVEFKYMTNNGTSIDLDIESTGEGPSYAVEADTITTIVNGSNLPNIGYSVFLRKQGRRIPISWIVTNKYRTVYNGVRDLSLTGLELMSGVTAESLKDFVGGNDETNNGFEKDSEGNIKKRIFSGKVNGTATLTGLPNCIISGILCIRAEKERTSTYNFGGNSVTVKEKTGGLKRIGFPFRVNVSSSGRLACMGVSKPKVVVYLTEGTPED